MSGRKVGIGITLGLLLAATTTMSRDASAQVSPNPDRDKTWGTVSSITMVGAGATELLMPRIFYSDPEVTVGWKARWHVSVLAPVMLLTGLTLLNDLALKDAIKDPRPGCDDTNNGFGNCTSYASPSTHAFGSFSALGHGAAVFIFDTTKWSNGNFNGGSLAGHVIVPFLFAGITAIGRVAGNWENFGQVAVGGLAGLGLGFLTGMTYSLMARPECGYTGSLICW
jgi:hypothetical protein